MKIILLSFLSIISLVGFAQTPSNNSNAKDTIVIVKKDTVFFEKQSPTTGSETIEQRRERLQRELDEVNRLIGESLEERRKRLERELRETNQNQEVDDEPIETFEQRNRRLRQERLRREREATETEILEERRERLKREREDESAEERRQRLRRERVEREREIENESVEERRERLRREREIENESIEERRERLRREREIEEREYLQQRRERLSQSSRKETVQERRDRLKLERAGVFFPLDTIPANPYETSKQREYRLREERRRYLRYQRLNYDSNFFKPAPDVRTEPVVWAYKLYPSKMLDIDFPHLTIGAERTYKGRYSLLGSLGFGLRPNGALRDRDLETGSARFGIRGIEAQLEGRYYISDLNKKSPFYMGLDVSYVFSALNMGLWVQNTTGTFEQFIPDIPVNADRFLVGALFGWEIRTEEGLAIDIAMVGKLGRKQIKSSNQQITQALNRRFEQPDRPAVFAGIRVGIGLGYWDRNINKSNKKNTKTKKKKR